MNSVALVGRLTRDPDLRYTSNGTATCSFTLAVDDPYAKGEKKADFINIVTWRQQAESCANYLRKGRLTGVTGRISTRHYDNNEGKRVYVTEVIADNVRFLERPAEGGQDLQRMEQHGSDTFAGGKPIELNDDDLPF